MVTLKEGGQATEQELRSFVAERLAAFKVPVRIIFWHETLPRNPQGKILKNELKKLFVEEPRKRDRRVLTAGAAPAAHVGFDHQAHQAHQGRE